MYELGVSHVPSTFPVSLSFIVLPVSKLSEPKKKLFIDIVRSVKSYSEHPLFITMENV